MLSNDPKPPLSKLSNPLLLLVLPLPVGGAQYFWLGTKTSPFWQTSQVS